MNQHSIIYSIIYYIIEIRKYLEIKSKDTKYVKDNIYIKREREKYIKCKNKYLFLKKVRICIESLNLII